MTERFTLSSDKTLLNFHANTPLVPNEIPSTVKFLHLSSNQPLNNNCVPSTVECIYFQRNFDRVLDITVVPSSVHTLKFFRDYSQTLNLDDIPQSICKLKCGLILLRHIKSKINWSILTNLTVDVGIYDRVHYNDIPFGVTHLKIGGFFFQELSRNLIPNSVTHLTFGEYFNKPMMRNGIPNSVTHLTFGQEFNCPLRKNLLPISLTHLTVGTYFNSVININSCIKIKCTHKNYMLFLENGSKYVFFYSTNTDITNKFTHSQTMIVNDNNYVVIIKNEKSNTKISFKLDVRLLKSARKI